LSRAVARPFSYVVCPVEVISIGAFSGVFISPWIKPALANRPASKKTSDRMANAKRTAAKSPCKGKTAYNAVNTAARRRLKLAFHRGFSLHRSVVPAHDAETSPRAIGSTGYYCAAALTTTHWSGVL